MNNTGDLEDIKNVENSCFIDKTCNDSADNSSTKNVTKYYRMLTNPNNFNKQWIRILKAYDLDLLKEPSFVNISVGMAVGMFTCLTFAGMFPLYIHSMQKSSAEVSQCISIFATGDFLSRLFLTLVHNVCTISNRTIFFIGLSTFAVSKVLLLQCTSHWSYVMMSAILGFHQGVLQFPYPLVFSEYTPARFNGAFSLGMVINGGCVQLFVPLIGSIQEYSNNYQTVIYVLSISNLLCILPWAAEFRNSSKKKLLRTNLSSSL